MGCTASNAAPAHGFLVGKLQAKACDSLPQPEGIEPMKHTDLNSLTNPKMDSKIIQVCHKVLHNHLSELFMDDFTLLTNQSQSSAHNELPKVGKCIIKVQIYSALQTSTADCKSIHINVLCSL